MKKIFNKDVHKSSSNSSCKVRILLSSKKGKRKIAKIKQVAILIKQIKQEIRIIIIVTSIR